MRPFGPIVEKPSLGAPIFLSEDILLALESGKYYQVPFIMGYTSREGLLFDLFAKLGVGAVIKDFELCVPYVMDSPKGSELSRKIAGKVKEFYMGNQTEKEFTENMHYDVSKKELGSDVLYLFYFSCVLICSSIELFMLVPSFILLLQTNLYIFTDFLLKRN